MRMADGDGDGDGKGARDHCREARCDDARASDENDYRQLISDTNHYCHAYP